MFIYFCQKCAKFEAFKSKTGNFKCPDCGGEYLPLQTTVDEWNELSNGQMLDAIELAKERQNIVIKTPDLTAEAEVSDKTNSDIDNTEYIDINDSPKRKTGFRLNRKSIILLFVGIVIAVILILLTPYIQDYSEKAVIYNQIQSLRAEKKYEEAKRLCNKIPDFKDVSQVLEDIKEEQQADIDQFNKEKYEDYYNEIQSSIKNISSCDRATIDSLIGKLEQISTTYDVSKESDLIYARSASLAFGESDYMRAQEEYNKVVDTGILTEKDNDQIKSIEQICKFLGKWQGKTSEDYLIIKQKSIEISRSSVPDASEGRNTDKTVDFTWTYSNYSNGSISASGGDSISNLRIAITPVSDNRLKANFCGVEYYYDKTDETVNYGSEFVPVEQKIEEFKNSLADKPTVGMTSHEASITKWGAPIDKNKTTYEWGVHEQWVFSGNRYVYLEDGIVTAVQE